MATNQSARLLIEARGELVPDTSATDGATGSIVQQVVNSTGGRVWSQGIASGNVDRCYDLKKSAMVAGSTDSYNLLAAGSLTDALGQAIDADELKGLVLKVTSGAVKLEAPAANFLGIFADATDVILLQEGTTLAFDWGAGGLALTTDGSFDITESTGAATADYTLWLVCAQ